MSLFQSFHYSGLKPENNFKVDQKIQIKLFPIVFIFFMNMYSHRSFAQDNITNENMVLSEIWNTVDKHNYVGSTITISKDSLCFDKYDNNMCYRYTIDSITNNKQFWISYYDYSSKFFMKYCFVKMDELMYVTPLKSKSGISDHFTEVFLYQRKDKNITSEDKPGIKELEIYINKNIILQKDCNQSYSQMENIFHIAFNQISDGCKSEKIIFDTVKFKKTSLPVDIPSYYHKMYKIFYDSIELPLVYEKNRWVEDFNIKEFKKSHALGEDSWLAIVHRFNPDRNFCNHLFGEEISGQIQTFEVIKFSCFKDRYFKPD
jgi:hypothetical protein